MALVRNHLPDPPPRKNDFLKNISRVSWSLVDDGFNITCSSFQHSLSIWEFSHVGFGRKSLGSQVIAGIPAIGSSNCLQQPSARAAAECWPDTPTIYGRVFHSSFHELVFLRGSASTHGLIRCWKATFGTAMGGSDQYPFIPKQRTISQELPSTTTQRTRNDTKACLILKLPKNDRYVSKNKYQVVT